VGVTGAAVLADVVTVGRVSDAMLVATVGGLALSPEPHPMTNAISGDTVTSVRRVSGLANDMFAPRCGAGGRVVVNGTPGRKATAGPRPDWTADVC
jgi:hypothetical protein